MDLSKFNSNELQQLKKDIDKELKRRHKQDVKEAQKELKNVAERYGLTLQDLLGDPVAGRVRRERLRVLAHGFQRGSRRGQVGLLGGDGVLTVRLQGGRDARARVQLVPFGEEAASERDPSLPWPGALPSPAPATLLPETMLARVLEHDLAEA
jgi:hypothetical protein